MSSDDPADVPPPATATDRPRLRTRLAARLPEIVIEALFVLLAVVLAFLVEEWREERELDRQAGEARSAIQQEIQRNRDELLESREELGAVIARLEASLEPGAPAADPAVLAWEIALLSSAAWRAAQSTEASRRMDYTWMLQVSQTYELQALHQAAQAAAIETHVTQGTTDDPVASRVAARILLARLRALKGWDAALDEDYARLLGP